MLPVMIVRFYMGWFEMLVIDLPADRGVVLVDFGVLRGRPARAVPAQLETIHPVPAGPDGGRRGADHHQHQGRFRGADRISDGVRAHRQVRRAEDNACELTVPPPQRMASLCRAGRGIRISGDRGLRDPVLQLPGDSVPAALRGRLLLGRRHHVVGRISGQAGLRARARTSLPVARKPPKHKLYSSGLSPAS